MPEVDLLRSKMARGGVFAHASSHSAVVFDGNHRLFDQLTAQTMEVVGQKPRLDGNSTSIAPFRAKAPPRTVFDQPPLKHRMHRGAPSTSIEAQARATPQHFSKHAARALGWRRVGTNHYKSVQATRSPYAAHHAAHYSGKNTFISAVGFCRPTKVPITIITPATVMPITIWCRSITLKPTAMQAQ